MRFLSILIFIFLILPECLPQWELVIDRDNIKVYNKPNEDNYSFYKAEGTVNAPIQNVYEVLVNIQDFPLWVNNCSETKIINSKDSIEFIYYSYYDLPWPATDRYSISHLKITHIDEQEIIFRSTSANEDPIKKENAILITRFNEFVRLTERKEGQTRIEMSGAYDPAGRLPAWVTDKFMKFGPYDTILKIRLFAEK